MYSGLTFLWYSGAKNIMIESKCIGTYDCKMRSNKVEYSITAGTYCTTQNDKMTFCMPEFSIRDIISHRFQVDNSEVD